MGNSDRTYGKAIVTRVILLAVAAALMTGLGAVPAAGSQTDTGLRGKVLRGPISPVCRSDVPCYVPFKGTLVFTRVVSLSGAPAKRAQTAADGTYRVLLAPGRYRVKLDLVNEGVDWFERCGSETTERPLWVI